MKLLRYALVVLMAAGLLVNNCSLFGSGKAKWTILAYMDGNNNLDYMQNGSSFVIGDCQEMEKVGSTDKVEILAMVGSLRNGGNSNYYHIEKHPSELPDQISSPVLKDMGGADMSDKQTLLNFIKYGVENYPAEHYMLIIDDHGGGWRGACEDEQNGAGDMMSMPEIRQALDTFHFDVLVFHACLMGMVEVGYELKDNVDYLVACQFTMPMQSILGSDKWLAQLSADPDMAPSDIASKVVDAVYATAEEKQKPCHMAASDLSKIGEVGQKISAFGNNMVTEAGEHWDEVLDAFTQTHYTAYDDPAFVDLREYCKKIVQEPNLKDINLIKNAAEAVISAINSCVVITKTNVPTVPRGGFCIHFPYVEELFEYDDYTKLQFAQTNWQNFLYEFINSTGGGGGDKGWLSINSTPQGATIWVDGTNSGSQTPAMMEGDPGSYQIKLTLSGYEDWQQDVTITAGETTYVNATLQQQGGSNDTCKVSGTVTWSGHTLSNFCVAFLDTIDGENNVYTLLGTQVNPANGTYQFVFTINGNMQVLADAWDDINNNQQVDAGDGWGFYDKNGNQGWDTGDLFTIGPGVNVSNVNITLETQQDADIGDPRRLTW